MGLFSWHKKSEAKGAHKDYSLLVLLHKFKVRMIFHYTFTILSQENLIYLTYTIDLTYFKVQKAASYGVAYGGYDYDTKVRF